MICLLCAVLGVIEHLIGRALAQETWANVVVSQEFEEALFIKLPESVLGHATLVSFDFMREVNLVYLEEYWSDVPEDERDQLVELNIEDPALMTSAQFVTLAQSIVQRQEVSRYDCPETLTGMVVRILVLCQLDQTLQKLFKWHVALVLVDLAEDEINSFLVHQVRIRLLYNVATSKRLCLRGPRLLGTCQQSGVLKHLVELMRLQVRGVQSIPK